MSFEGFLPRVSPGLYKDIAPTKENPKEKTKEHDMDTVMVGTWTYLQIAGTIGMQKKLETVIIGA